MGYATTTKTVSVTDYYGESIWSKATVDITVNAAGTCSWTLKINHSGSSNGRTCAVYLWIGNNSFSVEGGCDKYYESGTGSYFPGNDGGTLSDSFNCGNADSLTVDLKVSTMQWPNGWTRGTHTEKVESFTRNWILTNKPTISNVKWSNCVPDDTPTNTAKVTFNWGHAELDKVISYSGHYSVFRDGEPISNGLPFTIHKSTAQGELEMSSIGAQPGDVVHFLVNVASTGGSITSDIKVFTIHKNATPSTPSVSIEWNSLNLTLLSTVTATWKADYGHSYDVSICKLNVPGDYSKGGTALYTYNTKDLTVSFEPEDYDYQCGDTLYVMVRAYNETGDKYSTDNGFSAFTGLTSLSPSEATITSVTLLDVIHKQYSVDFTTPSNVGVNGISKYIVIVEDSETSNILFENELDTTNNSFIFPNDIMTPAKKYSIRLSAVSIFERTEYRSSTEGGAQITGYKTAGLVNYELPYITSWKNTLNPVSSGDQHKLCRLSQSTLRWDDRNSENIVPLVRISVRYYLWQDNQNLSMFTEELSDYEYGEHTLEFDIGKIIEKISSVDLDFSAHQYSIACEFNQSALSGNYIYEYSCGIFSGKIYSLNPENASNVKYVSLPRSYQSPFNVTFEAPVCDEYSIGVYRVNIDDSYELLGEIDFENSDILYDGSTYNTQFYMSEIGILEENVKGNERVVVGVSPVNVVGNISDSGNVEVVSEYISNDVIYTDTVAIFSVVYQNINFKIKPSQTPENDNVTYSVWLVYKDKNGIIQTKDVTNDIYLCYMKTNWDDVRTLTTSKGERLIGSDGKVLVIK